MRADTKLLIIGGIAMGIVCGVIFGIAFSSTSVEGFSCNNTTYYSYWNLTYLRNITSYCSNGGN
jgi:hypothetical protein